MTDADLLKTLKPADILTQLGGGKTAFTRDFKGRVVIPGNTVISTNGYRELFTIVVDKVTPKGVKDKNGKLYHSKSIYRIDEN